MQPALATTMSSGDESKTHKKTSQTETLTLYFAFCALCSLVWQSFRGIGLSTLPTLSVSLQILALVFLRAKIVRTQSVSGISAKSLQMQALVHGLRLCSTTWLKGYIPSDETGDWFYQLMDCGVLVLCLSLLHTILKTHRSTYQAESDDFKVEPVILLCFLGGVLVHPDLDDRIFFDSIWTTAVYLDVMSMLPQLFLMSKVGGNVEALTGHYVAMTACSRIADLVFWSFGFSELAPTDGGLNIAGWAIIIAQVLQVLLLADFMYFYVKAWMSACCANPQAASISCCSAPIPMTDAPMEV